MTTWKKWEVYLSRHKSETSNRHGTHTVSRELGRYICSVCGYQRRCITLHNRRWPTAKTRDVRICITCSNSLLKFILSFYKHEEKEWFE